MRKARPERLDVMKLAQAGQTLTGHYPGSALDRWSSSGLNPEQACEVAWSAQFELQTDAAGRFTPWLHLKAEAQIQLACQRCLQPMTWPQQVACHYRFVPTEELALAQDNESEEDVLSLAQPLDVLELVEDELIMDLPMVPLHDTCPVPVKTGTQTPDFVEKAHPFAALTGLKGQKTD